MGKNKKKESSDTVVILRWRDEGTLLMREETVHVRPITVALLRVAAALKSKKVSKTDPRWAEWHFEFAEHCKRIKAHPMFQRRVYGAVDATGAIGSLPRDKDLDLTRLHPDLAKALKELVAADGKSSVGSAKTSGAKSQSRLVTAAN